MKICDPILFPFVERLNLRFRTHRSGVWQNYKIWQVEDPLSSDIWRFAKYGEYPDATNPVFIQANHTVTLVKDQNCLDLNLNSDNDVVRFQTGLFKIIVAGTIGGFTGVAPGSAAAGTPIANWFTGTLELIGVAREVISGAWGITAGLHDQFSLVVDATGALTSSVSIRALNAVIKTGSFELTAFRLTDKCTIAQGATLKVEVLEKTASLAFNILILNGLLNLKNASPKVSAIQVANKGEVQYSATSSISVVNADPLANPFGNFKDITLDGIPNTMTKPIIVRGTLKLVGTLSRAAFDLDYQPGSELEYAGTILQTVTLQEWDNKNCPESVIFNNPNGVEIVDYRFLGEVGFPALAERCIIKEGVVFIKPFEISPRIGTGNPASVWVDENNFAILDENDLVILTQ